MHAYYSSDSSSRNPSWIKHQWFRKVLMYMDNHNNVIYNRKKFWKQPKHPQTEEWLNKITPHFKIIILKNFHITEKDTLKSSVKLYIIYICMYTFNTEFGRKMKYAKMIIKSEMITDFPIFLILLCVFRILCNEHILFN